ncbi:MAG: hypothetical protein II984_05170 [Clostridia bacterium]|nr:hypothetical protein [Clostridia bacterium]
METAQITIEGHEWRLKALERDVKDLKAVQSEIRTMNETLVMLANELKHTNEHLNRHKEKNRCNRKPAKNANATNNYRDNISHSRRNCVNYHWNACLKKFATSEVTSPKDIASAIFISITQGMLLADASVYVNQLYIQSQNKKRSFEISQSFVFI